MIDSVTISQAIAEHGMAVLAPLAVIEGPIVTVIAAYLASISLLDPYQVFVCVVLADLAGDSLYYAAGRLALQRLPQGLRARLGATPERIAALMQTFDDQGVRVVVIGKLTHAAGFAVLLAAGAARMAFIPFLLANLVATLPKSLALMVLGYVFGSAHVLIARWLSAGSAVILGVLVMTALGYVLYRRRLAA